MKILNKWPEITNNLQPRTTFPVILLLINLAILFQATVLAPEPFAPDGTIQTRYNNFLIFKHSFFNLFENLNLYDYHTSKYNDLFKYSPTFALLMAPLAILPDAPGAFLWNLLNTFVLYFAIVSIPALSWRAKSWIVLFILFELITNLRNAQSNALIAGMLIYSFVFFEEKKPGAAILLILGSAFIKLFGIIALLIALFYPCKIRSAVYTLFWGATLIILPALFIPYSHLIQQYYNWAELVRNDHSISLGLSVMGWLQSWFNMLGLAYKSEIVLLGAAMLCLPFVLIRRHSDYLFRLSCLSSLLIWMVIFNHRAESPTFIIAATGIAIWYFSTASAPVDKALLILAFIFTVLSPTDLFPKSIREQYVIPYVLKAVPCIFIWLRIWYLCVFQKINRIQPVGLPAKN